MYNLEKDAFFLCWLSFWINVMKRGRPSLPFWMKKTPVTFMISPKALSALCYLRQSGLNVHDLVSSLIIDRALYLSSINKRSSSGDVWEFNF